MMHVNEKFDDYLEEIPTGLRLVVEHISTDLEYKPITMVFSEPMENVIAVPIEVKQKVRIPRGRRKLI